MAIELEGRPAGVRPAPGWSLERNKGRSALFSHAGTRHRRRGHPRFESSSLPRARLARRSAALRATRSSTSSRERVPCFTDGATYPLGRDTPASMCGPGRALSRSTNPGPACR